jgi:hypothetical protein
MLRHITVPATLSILTALAIAATGCAQKGTIQAVETGGANSGAPVLMEWDSPEGERVTGTLTAKLPTGETFSGRYLQVGDNTSDTDLQPYWNGWSGSQWGTWPQDWGSGPEAEPGTFQMTYSERVIATLKGDRGGKMRCRFLLNSAEAGLAGGGMGHCQTGAGVDIDARFPKQTD